MAPAVKEYLLSALGPQPNWSVITSGADAPYFATDSEHPISFRRRSDGRSRARPNWQCRTFEPLEKPTLKVVKSGRGDVYARRSNARGRRWHELRLSSPLRLGSALVAARDLPALGFSLVPSPDHHIARRGESFETRNWPEAVPPARDRSREIFAHCFWKRIVSPFHIF